MSKNWERVYRQTRILTCDDYVMAINAADAMYPGERPKTLLLPGKTNTFVRARFHTGSPYWWQVWMPRHRRYGQAPFVDNVLGWAR